MGKTSNKLGVQQLVSSFLQHGIKQIIFSPGSRNAPLAIAFSQDENFECFVIPDERSAAFYALGMAEQTQNPVAVICTSGSALLNYYPAVSEAFYRNIPLVIVSADRPSAWIDQGDGQTIRQENVFQNHILGATSLLENPTQKDEVWWNQRKINEILLEAQKGGPVHLNFPFQEPLYSMVEKEEITTSKKAMEIWELEGDLSENQWNQLKDIWENSSKKLILCGQLPKNDYLNEQLKRLAEDKSVAVVVENTSNLQDRSFVHCIDRTISSFLDDNPELYQPDLLITIGSAIVSKKIKSYFRKFQPKNHWKIGKSFPYMDTFQSLSLSLPLNENQFFNGVLDRKFSGNNSRFGEQWKQLDYLSKGQHEDFLTTIPYSDLSVFQFILDCVPEQSVLHLANSSVVRYAQLFDPIKSITYHCNRGTSGIDGSMSTALGNTLADKKERVHTLIIGDMSFFYDSNAFWNTYLPTNFRVFLINNGGGGIFDIIPGPKSTSISDEFFVTKHNLSAKGICEAFDVNYFSAKSISEIDEQLNTFYDILPNNRPAVMEIFTNSKESSQILVEYFQAILVENAPVLEN